MAMRIGSMGQKIGMTQVFAENGERIPVTVIQMGPCHVVGKKTNDIDGYDALVLGFGDKPERLASKPELGFFKKSGVKPKKVVKEFRLPSDELEAYEIGSEIKANDVFENNIPVDITGVSKGKGYQGVIKRHNMSGAKASHGVHEYYRHGGSIGCRLTPGRVIKGKRMAGQMGVDTKTIQNLQLLQILEEDNCVLIRGSVPGAIGSILTIKKAVKRDTYKRVGMGTQQERSKNPLKASKMAAAGRG